ncbi:hypothetical protein CB0940_00393 [Cercospora beticola]|uniref:Synaptobrevin n=1 Tax=Cercospora beticola TaxID=122368 RepID=A0A2G5ICH5_CERBT|nr:hypothetical protein CB0940_00393 [Cercospora beticola]PIB02234.1 hypothetical protein CB0940_00393 [Cercospora beticola]WPA95809.1 hypothetical protein RHO25_000412 [Cercospora beticola]
MASPIALNRLLQRLDKSLTDPCLRYSQYERNRVAANIEHARAVLLTLEKQTSTIRVQTQRQAIQADLQAKRDWIKKLNTQLLELSAANGDSEDDEEFDDEEDDDASKVEREDILNKYAPAVQTESGLETGTTQEPRIDEQQQQELRSRRPEPTLQAGDNRSAASTTSREQLFGGRQQQKDEKGNLQKTEAMMSHNATEQEALTQGLLGLARALKESSQQFGASLESEKDVLRRAEGGLDRNAQGMEAAERRMGMLRRMSEGQGWWGRIKLYAFIFGLWVACFLVVFLLPKFRI